MRIGIEAQRLFRTQKHGMDIVALELIKSLQKIDKVNEYFLFVKEDQDEIVFIDQENFHTITLPARPYPIWEQVVLPRAAKKYNLDLLHCTANTAPIRCDIPLVLTLHDIIFLEKIELTKGSWYQRMGNLYRRWNVPIIINTCKMIVTVSNYEKINIIEHFNIDNDKIRTLHNGVGNHFKVLEDTKELEKIRQKYALPEKFIFAFINEDPRKNAENILISYIKLAENGYDIPLFVIESHPGYAGQLMRQLGRPDLIPKIIPANYLPAHDLPYIYNLALIFLFPSKREGFGIPVIEAMACGTPVVTAKISSMPEVAGTAAILVDPYDPVDISKGIEKLLGDGKIMKDYRQKGLARAQEFKWEETALKYLQVYEKVYGNA